MPKGTNQKRKLMVLARFLQKHSDEEHPLTLGQLQEELERWNAPAERKSIYDDMEQLRQLGLDVQTRRGVGGGWFIGQRDFELAELKLLVDAVESLASVHQARQLQRQVYVDRRIKTMNESIFYNVDRLHGAIGANRVISFHYFEMNMNKERVFRRGGAEYQVTPYGLIWDNENYYLAGWDHDREEVRHYRVDSGAGTGAAGTWRGTRAATSVCTPGGPASCGCGVRRPWPECFWTDSARISCWCPRMRGILPSPWTWW